MQKPNPNDIEKGVLHFLKRYNFYSSFKTSTGLVAEALMIW
jgi:hypothetical protein